MSAKKEPVLPICQGDWVSTTVEAGYFQVGRVRQSYWGGEPGSTVLMDLEMYAASGEKIGRRSPAEGGPQTFEPAMEFDERWQRIKKPEFPIRRIPTNRTIPDKPGWVALEYSYAGGLTTKALRTKPRKQSRDYVRPAKVIVISDEGNRVLTEAASLRRAAQELRDQARALPAAAEALRGRARQLETEAEALSGRMG